MKDLSKNAQIATGILFLSYSLKSLYWKPTIAEVAMLLIFGSIYCILQIVESKSAVKKLEKDIESLKQDLEAQDDNIRKIIGDNLKVQADQIADLKNRLGGIYAKEGIKTLAGRGGF